ncbi:coiled-coil alpha-helical rod protein 1 isoform X5 [Monodon monoceros]|uniref:coiled-coil alpha-helical rod protein 1 isoform X5 n=1 Tax=Monodon monoceros TaxID=40151 RepID=UPI0010F5DD37|nr:coiled-coil alpha-helical rod protein 1 isoform X5 [Monodon monoceros]
MFRPSGSTGLIPPSHFQVRPLPTLPRMAPTWVSDIPLVQPPAHQDALERRPDNQRPQVTMWGQEVSGKGQEPGWRGRSVELAGSQALSQQAELISRQLRELRRLEEEVRVLRETSLQQKMKLEAQAVELEALARAEKAGRAEAEGLRAALAGAEVVRKNLEEGSQRELEDVRRLHQEQIARFRQDSGDLPPLEALLPLPLSSLTQAHREALSSLTSKAGGLEKSLSSLETRRSGEAEELAAAQREAELLRKQLSKTQEDLEAQVTLVENLRRYVGEQVPPEVHSQMWESERQELLETVQHLREDRAGLRTTTELLRVRVQSLTHVLCMQEEELARRVQPSDCLEPEFTKKCQSLLKRWREKVFALMVQLKAQELEHRDCVEQLKGQVAELQEGVKTQCQEQAILQRSLQDKAAEVEVERMGAKALQTELSRTQEARRREQQQTATAEEQLKLVANAVSRPDGSKTGPCSAAPGELPPTPTGHGYEPGVGAAAGGTEPSGRRTAAERPHHPAGGEAERQKLSEVAQQLERELQHTQESLASLGLQLEAARQGQQESTAEAASLRQELTQQQEVYGQALQEKVAEVETRLREQLSESERRLNEARREHTKAVVSLRQIQRKATREKERNQELRRLQDEARKEEGQRLTQRLKELERDKNLMLATLQQEGLLSRYKQQRLLAVFPSPSDKGLPVESSLRPSESSAPAPPAAALCTKESIKGSLSVLLDDLQGLSEAISKEEAICEGDSQTSSSVCL